MLRSLNPSGQPAIKYLSPFQDLFLPCIHQQGAEAACPDTTVFFSHVQNAESLPTAPSVYEA